MSTDVRSTKPDMRHERGQGDSPRDPKPALPFCPSLFLLWRRTRALYSRPLGFLLRASAEAAGRSLPALQQPGALCFQRVPPLRFAPLRCASLRFRDLPLQPSPDAQDALLARQVGVRGIQGTAERPGRASS